MHSRFNALGFLLFLPKGAHGDFVFGNEGQDIIFGDFGFYNAEVEWPNRNFESIVDQTDHGGPDHLEGNDDDDFIIGGEGNDVILGGDGSDDIIGGHNARYGVPGDDILRGNEMDDAIIGDNGDILREVEAIAGSFPWTTFVWKRYLAPFNTEKMRDIQRYDDIDEIGGNDMIWGDEGNDILHGCRGDDTIYGGIGEDELYGETGDDTLYGGDGDDILIGDIGYAVRRYSSGMPLSKNGKPGVWHKDIILEELGNITDVHRISEKVNVQALTAESIGAASLLFVAGAYDADGSKYLDPSTGEWLIDIFTYNLEKSYDDALYAGSGDDGELDSLFFW